MELIWPEHQSLGTCQVAACPRRSAYIHTTAFVKLGTVLLRACQSECKLSHILSVACWVAMFSAATQWARAVHVCAPAELKF